MSLPPLTAPLRTITLVLTLLGAGLFAAGWGGPASAQATAATTPTVTATTTVEATAQASAAPEDAVLRQAALWKIALGAGGFLLVSASLGRLLQLGGLRQRLLSRAAEWEERLADLEAPLDRLGLDRDSLRAQLGAPGQTGALAAEVAADLDRIVGELAAMRTHIARCRAPALGGFALRAGPLQGALLALESPFEFDTGTLPAALRLRSKGEVLRLAGATRVDSLPGAVVELSLKINRLRLAAAASHRRTRAELPFDRLQRWTERLAALGLDPAWLQHHPLCEAEAIEAELEAVRRTDPARWIDELPRTQHAVRAAEERLHALTDSLDAIAVVRFTLPELPDCGISPEDDPARTLGDAARGEARLRRSLEAIELEPSIQGAMALLNLYRRAQAQVQAIDAAVAPAPPREGGGLSNVRRSVVGRRLVAGDTLGEAAGLPVLAETLHLAAEPEHLVVELAHHAV